MSYVELKDVYKRYNMGEVTITASDGVSFSIEKGEFAVVVGSSGAGKTTILNILGGMDGCDEGEVLVDGKDIAKLQGIGHFTRTAGIQHKQKDSLHKGFPPIVRIIIFLDTIIPYPLSMRNNTKSLENKAKSAL